MVVRVFCNTFRSASVVSGLVLGVVNLLFWLSGELMEVYSPREHLPYLVSFSEKWDMLILKIKFCYTCESK